MKTCTLYKMSGAWSPLWNLSSKNKFEIKSLDYWANVTVCHFPASISLKDLDALYADNCGIQFSCEMNAAAPKPPLDKSYGCNAEPLHQRADEIFGCGHERERGEFLVVLTMMGRVLVKRLKNGKFKVRQFDAK